MAPFTLTFARWKQRTIFLQTFTKVWQSKHLYIMLEVFMNIHLMYDLYSGAFVFQMPSSPLSGQHQKLHLSGNSVWSQMCGHLVSYCMSWSHMDVYLIQVSIAESLSSFRKIISMYLGNFCHQDLLLDIYFYMWEGAMKYSVFVYCQMSSIDENIISLSILTIII